MASDNDPAWEECGHCEDYWCNIHEAHVYECPCPGIDAWAEIDVCPYEPGSIAMGRGLPQVDPDDLEAGG